MTHVDVVCHAGQIQSIKVEGHAGQDEYGKDLACAGISTAVVGIYNCLLYTSPSPRDAHESRMPSSA